jgi:hypothetical protein
MNDDLDMLDFNEASDNEQKLFRTKSKDMTVEPVAVISTDSQNVVQPEHIIINTNSNKNSYFVIYYDRKKGDEIRNILSDKILKPHKFSYNEGEFTSALGDAKNIYFLFIDLEKRIIKAIMKKKYTKLDKNLKLETKIK